MSILEDIKKAKVNSLKNKKTNIEKATSESEVIKIKKEYDTLNLLFSEVSIIGKDNGQRETTDKEALEVITKFKKNVKFSIENNVKRDSNYNSVLEDIEISVCDMFLPKQMSDNELEVTINTIITDLEITEPSMKDMGKIMGVLNKEYKDMFEGKTASVIYKRIING